MNERGQARAGRGGNGWRRLLLVGAIAVAWPGAATAQLTPATVQRLEQAREGFEAVGELRRDPATARALLVRYLGGGAAAVDDPKALAARIDELIAQLDHRRYKTREQATVALIRIGMPALDKLRAVVADGSPEARARAKRVIAALQPKPLTAGESGRLGAVRALLLLAELGQPADRGVFLRLMESPDPAQASAAAFALRSSLGRGPAPNPIGWSSYGGERSNSGKPWRALLKAAPAKLGPYEHARKYLPPLSRAVVVSTTRTLYVQTLGRQPAKRPGPPPPPAIQQSKIETQASARYVMTVSSAAPFRLSRRMTAHTIVRRHSKGDPRRDTPLKGAQVEVGMSPSGELQLIVNGRPVELQGPRLGIAAPGQLIGAMLPGGAYRAGERRKLMASHVDQLGQLLRWQAGESLDQLTDLSGWATLVSVADGRVTLQLNCAWSALDQAGAIRFETLQGPLVLRDGVIERYALGGLIWSQQAFLNRPGFSHSSFGALEATMEPDTGDGERPDERRGPAE